MSLGAALLPKRQGHSMRLAGFLLLLAGWGIVLAALALLSPAMVRTLFVLAGLGVEVLGIALVIRSYPLVVRKRG